MKRIPAAMVLLLIGATVSPASPPAEPAPVLVRLRSAEPSEIAWGAYLAGKRGVKEAVSLLVDALRPREERTGPAWDHAHRAVLDALIRLDARAPGEILRPHLGGRSATLALILAAREPGKNRGLLTEEFDRRSRGHRVGVDVLALGNILCARKAPGFAARLMRWVELKLTLSVRDPGQGLGVRVSGRSLVAFGDGVVEVPEGFPPYARYEMKLASKVIGATVFAPGPQSVGYLRTERKERRFGVGGGSRDFGRDAAARDWLACHDFCQGVTPVR